MIVFVERETTFESSSKLKLRKATLMVLETSGDLDFSGPSIPFNSKIAARGHVAISGNQGSVLGILAGAWASFVRTYITPFLGDLTEGVHWSTLAHPAPPNR